MVLRWMPQCGHPPPSPMDPRMAQSPRGVGPAPEVWDSWKGAGSRCHIYPDPTWGGATPAFSSSRARGTENTRRRAWGAGSPSPTAGAVERGRRPFSNRGRVPGGHTGPRAAGGTSRRTGGGSGCGPDGAQPGRARLDPNALEARTTSLPPTPASSRAQHRQERAPAASAGPGNVL